MWKAQRKKEESGERSKSESLYLTSMINVQEYASEALVQRGWHLAEFHCTYLWRRKNRIHKELQTGLQVYSRVRERGEVHEIDKMSGKLQGRHRGHKKLEVGVERRSLVGLLLLGFHSHYLQAHSEVTAWLSCHVLSAEYVQFIIPTVFGTSIYDDYVCSFDTTLYLLVAVLYWFKFKV